MAPAKKPSILKRERERARAERAARKRASRAQAQSEPAADGPRVATREELSGYGVERPSAGEDESAC